MKILVKCPMGHKLNVPVKYAGVTVRCPACKQSVVVPAESARTNLAPAVVAQEISEPKAAVVETPAPAKSEFSESLATSVTPPLPAKAPRIESPSPASRPRWSEDAPRKPSAREAAEAGTPAEKALIDAEASQTAAINGANASAKPQIATAARTGYVAERSRRFNIYCLAVALYGLAILAAVPALSYFRLSDAPGWARIVLLLSLLELAYATWLWLSPDWSAAWVAMVVTGLFAATYAAGTALMLLVEPSGNSVWNLSQLKQVQGSKPLMWCAAMTLVASTIAYFCGLVSYRWRKALRVLAAAKRSA